MATDRSVQIPAGAAELDGDLLVPDAAQGIVVFAHGSGSSRHSSRNRQVARALQSRGLGTLLMDLLTGPEEQQDLVTREHRFDIDLLGRRVVAAVDWTAAAPETAGLAIGLFGASTGAAAALIAAAERPAAVGAVVSRGGRPDLAAGALADVRAPVLLIVGERDPQVIDLNHQAAQALSAPVRLEVVRDATHLFEEPGALETVAQLAGTFFAEHLPAAG
jgi:putative phosphoribosyl transferase